MKVKYDYDEQIIYIDKEGGSKEILADDFPSEPLTSPDGTKVVYISPLEWETLGKLYMYDLLSEEQSILLEADEKQNIPKVVKWINDHKLFVIIGYAYGTVAIGGNLFMYDLDTEELKQLTHYDMKTQIIDVNIDSSKERVLLQGIQYTDEEMAKFKKISVELELMS